MIPRFSPARTDARGAGCPALIGLAGAIGAFGGVLVNLAFRQSFLTYKTGDGAYLAFLASTLCARLLAWVVYLRRSEASAADGAAGRRYLGVAGEGGQVVRLVEDQQSARRRTPGIDWICVKTRSRSV